MRPRLTAPRHGDNIQIKNFNFPHRFSAGHDRVVALYTDCNTWELFLTDRTVWVRKEADCWIEVPNPEV
jgi:hypothetical protein